MQTTLDRPAIDVQARSTHPVLALVLALLSVPGSTVAWDLPMGGLWIGMPLAAVAIVLGVRANREPGGSRLGIAAIAIAALMVAVVAVCFALALVD